MRQKHRVVIDIGAAQVQQPGNVIKRRQPMPLRPLLLHLLANRLNVGDAGATGVRRHVFIHRRRRQGRPVNPDLGHQIKIGHDSDLARLQDRLPLVQGSNA